MTSNTPKKFDFAALDYGSACEVPYEFEITHPDTGEGLNAFISVIGTESGAFKNAVRKMANARRLREFENERKGKNAPVLIEEDEKATLDLVCACVVGWRNIIVGGKELEFNTDNLRSFLTQFDWVRGQIDKASTDMGNFTKG